MAIITLTTDMGLKDHYVASVKGSIYSQLPDARIVDISHQIEHFNIIQTAFVLRSVYKDFPKGTVHVIGVDTEAIDNIEHLVVLYDGHYFLGADNGVFSLMFDKDPEKILSLNLSQEVEDLTFPTKDVLAKAACFLARGGTLEFLGQERHEFNKKKSFTPIIDKSSIRGFVSYIDAYGNAITNIDKGTFSAVGRGRSFNITFSRANYEISKISKTYSAVIDGEKLALFNTSNWLEIAINKGVKDSGGGAAQLFGLNFNSSIIITFNDN